MRRSKERKSAATKTRWTALAATVLVAATEALAQERKAAQVESAAQASQSPVRRIVVSILDRKLALIENGRAVKIYAVAVGGKASPSPVGEFKIVHRIAQPTYYAPGKIIPPGRSNPLGTRWLGLSQKGYGIHGTNEPGSIGRNASHGCIRMRNRDVEELFELVRSGDVVELHGERTAELAAIFGTTGRVPGTVLTAASASNPATASTDSPASRLNER